MSWIAEYDTQGREFPIGVHVTKTTGTMTHGATYVPIEDGRAVRAENAKLRELATEAIRLMQADGPDCGLCKHYSECWTGEAMDYSPSGCVICTEARELGIEV